MEFTTESIFIIIFIAAICISLLVSMIGLGGGIIYLPMLILIFGLPTENAVAVSLCGMTATTVSATIAYWNQNKINIRLAIIYNLLDIPGVLLGAWLTLILHENVLSFIAGSIIIVMASMLLRKKTRKSDEIENERIESKTQDANGSQKSDNGKNSTLSGLQGTESEANKKASHEESNMEPTSNGKSTDNVLKRVWEKLWKDIPRPGFILLSSFVGGFITGLVGVGGGTTDTTSMIILGVPIDVAAATSAFAMAMTNTLAVTTHGAFGNILWEYALPLAIGAVIGAQLGGKLSKRVNSTFLKYLLCTFAIVSGFRLLLTPFNLFG